MQSASRWLPRALVRSHDRCRLTGRPAIDDHPTIAEADDAETRLAASLAREQTLVGRVRLLTVENERLAALLAAFTSRPPYEPGWMERRPGLVMALGGATGIAVMALGMAFGWYGLR